MGGMREEEKITRKPHKFSSYKRCRKYIQNLCTRQQNFMIIRSFVVQPKSLLCRSQELMSRWRKIIRLGYLASVRLGIICCLGHVFKLILFSVFMRKWQQNGVKIYYFYLYLLRNGILQSPYKNNQKLFFFSKINLEAVLKQTAVKITFSLIQMCKNWTSAILWTLKHPSRDCQYLSVHTSAFF